MEIKRFTSNEKALFEQSCSIRKEVFVNEQNVDIEMEFTEDDEATHFLIIDEDKAVATARWRETNKGFKLERFAVIKELRGKGYGKIILNQMIEDLNPLQRPIYLHSHANTSEFYRTSGFEVIGHSFYEVGHELYMMVLKERQA